MAEKQKPIPISEDEKNEMLKGTIQLKDFTLGDFLTDDGVSKIEKNSSAKRDKNGNKIALYQSGLADREAINEYYVPMVAKYREALGKANTQEEFNDVVDNFAKKEIQELTTMKEKLLDRFNQSNNSNLKSFSELSDEDLKKLGRMERKDYNEGKQLEDVLKIENLDKLALRPSTYAFSAGTNAGKYSKNILDTLAGKDIASFIENNETLKQKVVLLDDEGEPRLQSVYKRIKKEENDKTDEEKGVLSKFSQKSNYVTKFVEQPHIYDIKDNLKVGILNELSEKRDAQTDEIIAYRQKKIDNISFTSIESVASVLSKGFEDKFEIKDEDGEIDLEATDEVRGTIKTLKENVSNLFPKITESNLLTVAPAAKIASINPELLKDKQEKNSYFASEMVKKDLRVVRQLPDDVVKYAGVTKAIEDKIAFKNTSDSTKQFAQLQLDYIQAVKDGKKEEFLAKEEEKKEEKKEAKKEEKNSVEEAKKTQIEEKTTNTEKKEVEKAEKTEKATKDVEKDVEEDFEEEYENDLDDEFPF